MKVQMPTLDEYYAMLEEVKDISKYWEGLTGEERERLLPKIFEIKEALANLRNVLVQQRG